MATLTKKTKKNERILDRKLAKALIDLNKIFPQEEIVKRFTIKKWRISAYKRYKKRKPFDKRKRRAILKFYDDILDKKPLQRQYDYRVVKKRVRPIVDHIVIKTRDLKTRIGIKKLAREMKVKPETITKWEKGKQIPSFKKRQKLWQITQKYLKRLVGIFFVSKSKPKEPPKKGFEEYSIIFYQKIFYGTKKEFHNFIRIGVVEMHDSLIGERGTFKKKEATNFLENLEELDKAYLRSSAEACRDFLKHNFKGAILTKLLRLLRKIC